MEEGFFDDGLGHNHGADANKVPAEEAAEFSKEEERVLHETLELVESCISWMLEAPSEAPINEVCSDLIYLGEQGEPLSSELFNTYAENLIALLLNPNVKDANRVLLLAALCACCRWSDPSKLAYSHLKRSLEHLSQIALSLPVEAQPSLFILLSRSLLSKEHARERAEVWFPGRPLLQNVVTTYFQEDLAEGCGQFVNVLHSILKRPSSSQTKRPSSSPTERPSSSPTERPNSSPTERPSSSPTERPSSRPTERPSSRPTERPSSSQIKRPSSSQIKQPSSSTTEQPSMQDKLNSTLRAKLRHSCSYSHTTCIFDDLRRERCYALDKHAIWHYTPTDPVPERWRTFRTELGKTS